MRFLEYMGFVLAVFPLKYGFIIVQVYMYLTIKVMYSYQLICSSIHHIYVGNSIPSVCCGITGSDHSFTFQLSGNGVEQCLHDYCSVY